ncbi:MAG: polynucleotide kinase-phosphatase [Candidatus Sumerlaeia bacterium]
MNISIPELSLVVMVGASGSGKSTFARRHFKPTEVLSSDFCRALVSDDENSMDATGDAFDVLNFIAAKRLAAGRLTVVDATNVQPDARKPLVTLARRYHCLPVAIVLDLPDKVCLERNRSRADRTLREQVIRQHITQLRRSRRRLKLEGFRHIFVLDSVEAVEAARVERQPLWNNLRHETGPFDIIGDVHGCHDELCELLARLGYAVDGGLTATPPPGRKAVFLGDLVDRGPKIPQVLRLVMSMAGRGAALCVPGNHDMKLLHKLGGRNVHMTHGLEASLEQLAAEPDEFKQEVSAFLDGLVSHYVLDGGNLVVAHAGMKEEMQGRGSGAVRSFALYGETTGETDEFGLPVRVNWAAEYRGRATVVYGHTPTPEPQWVNRTIDIDTGCVFGGQLTALRYPEREIVSVAARATYCEPVRPLEPAPAPAISAQQELDDVLDFEDVSGKRLISTRLQSQVVIREENSMAALEAMSRFAANPKWLIYLPPTMSPCETSREPGMLEHPAEALEYYRGRGVGRAVCEQKHMGSRCVAIVCRDAGAAARRFGVEDSAAAGIFYTRTGRPFFADAALQAELLGRLRGAMDAASFWDEFGTDWACLDCELMPWSAKARELLRLQYAPVGASAQSSLADATRALEAAAQRGQDVAALVEKFRGRAEMAGRYVQAYRQYCWPVASADDYRLAPFHLLATEGAVHVDKDHAWHMETLARVCAGAGDFLIATPYRVVDLADDSNRAGAIRWWLDLTAAGGEGMVVKPLDYIATGKRGLLQPAVKCRGREYLRIIYGLEYTAPENLERLRSRGLSAKRSLALREFALGIESLERFIRREPLRRVHECAFGVLALESEPVDPRL